MKKIKTALILLLITIASSPLKAQGTEVPHTRTYPGIENPAFPYAQPEEVGVSSENLSRLSDELVSWVANGDLIGGELLIIKDGRAIFHEAYGWSDREERRPMERNFIYNGASMAKPYTGTAILILVDQGVISLDDPVSKYLKEFPDDETKIFHLLTHTSGFGIKDDKDIIYPIPDSIQSRSQWVNLLIKHPKIFELGHYNYTNYNHYFLAQLIEEVSGISTEEFISKNILEPLGANDTYPFLTPKNTWHTNVPSIYEWDKGTNDFNKKWSHEMAGWSPFFTGSTDMYISAMDFGRLLSMWMNGGIFDGDTLLSEELVAQSLQVQSSNQSYGYGYNWFVNYADNKLNKFGHGGLWGTNGYAFPQENIIVLFFSQSWPANENWTLLQNRLSFLEILDDNSMTFIDRSSFKEIELDPEYLEKYSGNYNGENLQGDTLQVMVGKYDERLYMQIAPPGERAGIWQYLAPIGKHTFVPGHYRNGQITWGKAKNVRVKFIFDDSVSTIELMNDETVVFQGERVRDK